MFSGIRSCRPPTTTYLRHLGFDTSSNRWRIDIVLKVVLGEARLRRSPTPCPQRAHHLRLRRSRPLLTAGTSRQGVAPTTTTPSSPTVGPSSRLAHPVREWRHPRLPLLLVRLSPPSPTVVRSSYRLRLRRSSNTSSWRAHHLRLRRSPPYHGRRIPSGRSINPRSR